MRDDLVKRLRDFSNVYFVPKENIATEAADAIEELRHSLGMAVAAGADLKRENEALENDVDFYSQDAVDLREALSRVEKERDEWKQTAEGHRFAINSCGEQLAAMTKERDELLLDLQYDWQEKLAAATALIEKCEEALQHYEAQDRHNARHYPPEFAKETLAAIKEWKK